MELMFKVSEGDVTWHDVNKSLDNCVTKCAKGETLLFRIYSSKDAFFASYYNDRVFVSPRLTYHKAAEMALEKFGVDTLENRLQVAKEFFLKDYQNQALNMMRDLTRHMTI